MGKKKKRGGDKVWCYYCEREFEDEKILVQHQKAKHFKCHVCQKKLSTASGMSIHVLQVHKESVTKVPNAKPGRESTDIDIYGMQGIPADVLAAHYADDEEDNQSKVQKVDIPSVPLLPGVVPGTMPPGYPPRPFAPMQTMYRSLAPPTGWPVPPRPQYWYPQHPSGPALPPGHMGYGQQPLFPVQSVRPPPPVPTAAPPTLQASQVPTRVLPSSMPQVPVSQPLFPVVNNNVPPSSPYSAPLPAGSIQSVSPSGIGLLDVHSALNSSVTTAYPNPNIPGGSIVDSHSYASGPETGGPSIGPPPVIANKASVPQPSVLVWDDEAMSMEERRMSLPKYQVHDENSQMSSIDAAIDRRILESRLAGRMAI